MLIQLVSVVSVLLSKLVPLHYLLPEPLQAPRDEINRFSFISNRNRRKQAAMISLLDKSIGKVITELKTNGLLQNSVLVFFSDNGAPSNPPMILNPGSNFPLRGVSFIKT